MYKLTKLPADMPIKRVEVCKHCGGESLVVWDQGRKYDPTIRDWSVYEESCDCRNPECDLYTITMHYEEDYQQL